MGRIVIFSTSKRSSPTNSPMIRSRREASLESSNSLPRRASISVRPVSAANLAKPPNTSSRNWSKSPNNSPKPRVSFARFSPAP